MGNHSTGLKLGVGELIHRLGISILTICHHWKRKMRIEVVVLELICLPDQSRPLEVRLPHPGLPRVAFLLVQEGLRLLQRGRG